jgi:serine/threonine protein kinase
VDSKLLGYLLQGEYCHVIGPHQIGKSSLRVRASTELENKGVLCIHLDLNGIGGNAKETDLFYTDFILAIASALHIEDDSNRWLVSAQGSPVRKFKRFFSDYLIKQCKETIVIMVDELDDISTYVDLADDFFLALRSLANERSIDEDLQRLSFCLFGSLPVSQLIKSTNRTAYNVGQAIQVGDFTWDQVLEFREAISPWVLNADEVLRCCYSWTGGHPCMVQRVLISMIRKGPTTPFALIEETVEKVVRELYLKPGTESITLNKSGQRCLLDEPEATALMKLDLYMSLLDRGSLEITKRDPVQIALYLAGMAAFQFRNDSSVLILRNKIYSRVFDKKWVDTCRRSMAGVRTTKNGRDTEEPVGPESSLSKVNRLVDSIFCQTGNYKLIDNGIELITAILFRFRVADKTEADLSLHVFNLEGLGAELWDREMRVLVGVSGLRHPSLPYAMKHGYIREHGIAYILTECARDTLENPGLIEDLRKDRAVVLRQLNLLAEGLVLLHGSGLAHRNLHPANIELISLQDGDTLRMARFEMSSLITNLSRAIDTTCLGYKDELDLVWQYYKNQGITALLCAAPERLSFINQVPNVSTFEDSRSDVFSLGIIAYMLLIGPLPTELGEAVFPNGSYDHLAHRQFINELERRIRTNNLPRKLESILLKMIEPERRNRYTSAEVADELVRNYEEIAIWWEELEENNRYLVTYHEDLSLHHLKRYGMVSHEPGTPQGREELLRFLNEDLDGGTVAYSADGVSRYVDRPDKNHREAHFALLGKKMCYFAHYFFAKGYRIEKALMIRYAVPRNKAHRLSCSSLHRTLPPLQFVPHNSHMLEHDSIYVRPPWDQYLKWVERSNQGSWAETMEYGLEWLLWFSRLQLDMRAYPVKVEFVGRSLDVFVEYDAERDRTWISSNKYRSIYASKPNWRPPMGDFFHNVRAEKGAHVIHIVPDERGNPSQSRRKVSVELTFVHSDGQYNLTAHRDASVRNINQLGWAISETDDGTSSLIRRQANAFRQLLRNPGLVEQLGDPRSASSIGSNWPGLDENLKGKSGEILEMMLDSWPMYALQGPPGTGKTTIASHAIKNILMADRTQHILVSAQSHYALDNLCTAVLRLKEKSQADFVALRIMPSSKKLMKDEAITNILPEVVTKSRVERIQRHCEKWLEKHGYMGELAEIIQKWQKTVPLSTVELDDRLRRGANIVFCTTGIATQTYLRSSTDDIFDWVIVEEAAKAWPTELIMPLVFGQRWALIGDHRQLPAFGRQDIEAFLDECRKDGDDELEEFSSRKVDLLRVFDIFKEMFNKIEDASCQGETSNGFNTSQRPVSTLSKQFRMHPNIAKIVGYFYREELGKRGLDNDESVNERVLDCPVPQWLKGQPLLWIDMAQSGVELPSWKNEKEISVIEAIIKEFEYVRKGRPWGLRGKIDNESLAILAPYRSQVSEIKQKIVPQYSEMTYTVDAFQGREADFVIVSLVRFNSGKEARHRIGFLTEEQRINVLFSRARYHLIIIGSFDHFKKTPGTFWPEVCDLVTKYGKRLNAEELGLLGTSIGLRKS